ncbi:MAG: phosphopantothenoylcysteine decarboxylase [Planctomycetes bacterium]|nr:phosphopantothenoylcysteine decarboxylase [Planctomycetota bacterium]
MVRVLVTAGPTVEALDPVRFLSNRSSGRMGYAVARALLARGHEVVLVSGPVSLRAPAGVTHLGVESAREMLRACRDYWQDCDALYAVAAVADYRPKRAVLHKLKRHEGEGQVIELTPNPDIVRTLARSKQGRLVVGFALESRCGEVEARRKMEVKKLDFVALNGPEAQGAERSSLLVLGADGSRVELGPTAKPGLARRVVRATLG